MPKAKILIVDDRCELAKLLEIILTLHGYTIVGKVSRGEEALEIALRDNPDLVLMDIMLDGEIDGIQTAEIIMNRMNIPVVFVSAYSNQSIKERALSLNPSDYISKPFLSKYLISAVEKALVESRARQLFSIPLYPAEKRPERHSPSLA